MFVRPVLKEQNITEQTTDARTLIVSEAQCTSLKSTIATVQTAKSHSITADNVYPVFLQTDGILPQDHVCMAHRLYGRQLQLRDEIKF
jgi:hypothetical protein